MNGSQAEWDKVLRDNITDSGCCFHGNKLTGLGFVFNCRHGDGKQFPGFWSEKSYFWILCKHCMVAALLYKLTRLVGCEKNTYCDSCYPGNMELTRALHTIAPL